MRSIDPLTMPSSLRSASSAWVSTSTSALPMATTSVAGVPLTPRSSLRHGLPGAKLDGDPGGRAGRSSGGPRRESVVVDRPEPATDGGGAAVERGALGGGGGGGGGGGRGGGGGGRGAPTPPQNLPSSAFCPWLAPAAREMFSSIR